MHAMDFYVSTCRCVMQADPEIPESWAELDRLLPCLRQSLSCYVCFQLLLDPMGPDHNVCKHSVCQNCLGGKMKLKPSCSWCKDHWEFVPNSLLKVLVACFKKLCVYIYNSQIGRTICSSSVNGETNNLVKILKEVVDFNDNYSMPTLVEHTFTNPERPCELKSETDEQPADDVKPGCSSDDNTTCSVNSPCEDLENIDTELKSVSELALPRRRHLSRSSTRAEKSCEVTEAVPVDDRNKQVHKKTLIKKSAVKTVFMKKTPQSNRKSFLRKKTHILKQAKQRAAKKKQTISEVKHHGLRRQSSRDVPQNLEKIDCSEPLVKKIKKELQPPQLKPPSFCKCGKSGNFNQLTCLGQRCPCYSMKLPCIGCKCKGCRNPKKGPNVQSSKLNYMSDLWASCSRTSSAVS